MSREGPPQVFRQTGLVEELDEFLPLAIGEGVHRVDHDSPGAPLFAGGTAADRRINDRDEEAERLSRTGAGRDCKALSRYSLRYGLHLMPIKGDRLAVDSKDAGRVRMERPILNQRFDG
jgi:hypothetical protein